MTFSVIIPLYNKRETVARAIRSALAQSCSPHEIIVVDDGSRDDWREIVAPFESRIRLVEQANAGPAAARNHGARLSTGDYLVFLDADDELEQSSLAEHRDCFNSNPDVDLSLASFRKQYANGVTAEECLSRRAAAASAQRFVHYAGFSPAGAINIVAGGICIRRELFERIGGFDEALRCWEITDLLMRAGLAARTVSLHDKVSVICHELPQNSQFLRTQGVPEYRFRFGVKIAERLGQMSEPGRSIMRSHALGLTYSLWRDGCFVEVKRLYSALAPYLGHEQRAAKLYLIQLLPVVVQKLILSVYARLSTSIREKTRDPVPSTDY